MTKELGERTHGTRRLTLFITSDTQGSRCAISRDFDAFHSWSPPTYKSSTPSTAGGQAIINNSPTQNNLTHTTHYHIAMSLTHLLHEFRPLFRTLEDPLSRGVAPTFYAPARSLLEHPFFQSPTQSGVDLTEEGDNYIVEAELPGVKKENVNISIGDGGQSVKIEGKVVRRGREAIEGWQRQAIEGGQTDKKAVTGQAAEGQKAPTEAEPQGAETARYESSFSRTVWLPRPVVASKVQAKLVDGILTVTIPKAAEAQDVRVPIE
ncbi:hypothetical protein PLICRDRAFT_43546 [Plicaturopsis crispa FD-325 SS-3]|nr:hypothetical protein PLICRDRAFT_43546 [Plicaturopsis crispa FD-325 SS-3]